MPNRAFIDVLSIVLAAQITYSSLRLGCPDQRNDSVLHDIFCNCVVYTGNFMRLSNEMFTESGARSFKINAN